MTLLADGQRLIQEQFAAVPEHKRGALVAIADLDGVKLGVAARFGDDWKLAAEFERTWAKDMTARIAVVHTW